MKLSTRIMLYQVHDNDIKEYLQEKILLGQLDDKQVKHMIKNMPSLYMQQNIIPVSEAFIRGMNIEEIERRISLLDDACDRSIFADEEDKDKLYNKVPSIVSGILNCNDNYEIIVDTLRSARGSDVKVNDAWLFNLQPIDQKQTLEVLQSYMIEVNDYFHNDPLISKPFGFNEMLNMGFTLDEISSFDYSKLELTLSGIQSFCEQARYEISEPVMFRIEDVDGYDFVFEVGDTMPIDDYKKEKYVTYWFERYDSEYHINEGDSKFISLLSKLSQVKTLNAVDLIALSKAESNKLEMIQPKDEYLFEEDLDFEIYEDLIECCPIRM